MCNCSGSARAYPLAGTYRPDRRRFQISFLCARFLRQLGFARGQRIIAQPTAQQIMPLFRQIAVFFAGTLHFVKK